MISSLASDCTSGFLLCASSSHYTDLDAIDDARGRFNVWAANLGALQPPQSPKSLEFRLKDAKLMRDSVVSGLERLSGVQIRISRIVTGEQPNRRQTKEASEDVNPETSEPALDELHELLLNMKTCIDHLFGLSTLIRRLRPRGKLGQLSLFKPSPNSHRDIVTVMDKFPKVKQTQWLADNLGRANDQRRQFFAYRQQHREQLGIKSKSLEVLSEDDDATLRAATTVATTFEDDDGGPSEPGDIQPDQKSVVTAATSFVSDFDDIGLMGRRVPDLPDMTLDGVQLGYDKLMECPYCRTIHSFRDRLTWKKHVFSDLQPYTCTFENCSVTAFSNRNDWFQHELDSHRRRWECILCDNPRPNFVRQAQIATHLKEQHEANVTESQIDLIIDACEASTTKFDASSCPLCSEWVPPLEEAVNLREFRRHLARHLQQISLEALPLYIEGLVIQETFGQDNAPLCKRGVVIFDLGQSIHQFPDGTSPLFVNASLPFIVGDNVIILDNTLDKKFWQVRIVRTGQECLIPAEWVRVFKSTVLLTNPQPEDSKLRTWTTRSGSSRIQAQFLGFEDDKIILHKSGGTKIRVPRDELSLQDLAHLESIMETETESEDDRDPGASVPEEGPLEGTSAGERSIADYWIPQATPDGRVFYYKSMTRESSSELPLGSSSSATEATPRDQNLNEPDRMQAEKNKPDAGTPLRTALSARVVSYDSAEDEGWFIVQALLEGGQTWELTRSFQDVQTLHTGLLAEFPSEAKRFRHQTLTQHSVRGPIEDYTIRRLPDLNAYLKALLRQPPHVSNCAAAKHFFAPRDGDDEIEPVDWSEGYTDGLYQHRHSLGPD